MLENCKDTSNLVLLRNKIAMLSVAHMLPMCINDFSSHVKGNVIANKAIGWIIVKKKKTVKKW